MKIILCDSNTINSYGFRTEVTGINLERFEKNPVMLYNHDAEKIIGKWQNIQIEKGKLIAEPVFDMEDPFAAEIARKVEQGFIKGCSMGLVVREITRSKNVDIATQSVLLEASIVSIPADENALVIYSDEDKTQQLSINEFNKLYYTMKNENTENAKQEVETLTLNLAEAQNRIELLTAELTAKNDMITELSAQVDDLKKDLAEREFRDAEAFVDKAIEEGKITKEVRSTALRFYLENTESTVKLFNAIKVNTPEKEENKVSLSSLIKEPAPNTLTWDELDHKKGALAALKANNFEEFQRLYKEKFGSDYQAN